MKKIFIMTLMFITSLCASHFIGKSEITNNTNEQVMNKTNEIIADVETKQPDNEVVTVKITENKENIKQEEIKQEEIKTNQVKQEKVTQPNSVKENIVAKSSNKTQDVKKDNTQTTSTKKNESTQEKNKQDKSIENKESNKETDTKTNNTMKCEHSNKNWYNTQEEAIAVYKNKLKYWEDQWANYEIDDETFYKNKPNGYEIWDCAICHKWTIKLY